MQKCINGGREALCVHKKNVMSSMLYIFINDLRDFDLARLKSHRDASATRARVANLANCLQPALLFRSQEGKKKLL